MRSAGLPVILIGSPINLADHSIGSPIAWHHTAAAVPRRRLSGARLLPAGAKLRPVLNELAYNLESFNPAFTAVLLKVRPRSLLAGLRVEP